MKKTLFIVFACLAFSGNALGQGQQEPTGRETAKVRVFPNPATSVITVLGLKNSASAAISISDSYGNVLLQYQWSITNKAVNIPVSDLNPGIYTIAIRSKEQQLQTRFYKQ